MTPVEKLQEFCRRHELNLDTKHGTYGVSLDGEDGHMVVWLWHDASLSVEYASPDTMAAILASVRELGLLEHVTYQAIERHRNELRALATEAAQ